LLFALLCLSSEDRACIQDELRHDNLDVYMKLLSEEFSALTERVEELEHDAAVHPLAKLVGKKAKKAS